MYVHGRYIFYNNVRTYSLRLAAVQVSRARLCAVRLNSVMRIHTHTRARTHYFVVVVVVFMNS